MNKQKIANDEQFASYEEYLSFIQALTDPASPVAKFETAVDAIPLGNTQLLSALLNDYPELIRMRSLRRHHAMLIHYIGANGVEHYRQRTPANAVAILQLLLDAGADVNATVDLYGGATTLGLVATSVHPDRAGMMAPLLGALLQAGADIEYASAGGNQQKAVVAALHNGRWEGANFLAAYEASLDLEAAAGTGRLEVVKEFFNEDGSLKANATADQMQSGFLWACAYGHTDTADYLIHKGVDIDKQVGGLYALHWAIMEGRHDVIKLLLASKASLEVVNVYGGNAIGAACWAVTNRETEVDDVYTFELLLKAGAKAPKGMIEWLQHQDCVDATVVSRISSLVQPV